MPVYRPADVRFWEKVDKTDDCWLWIGGRRPTGYGQFWDGTRNVSAHRWSYEALVGPIPEGLVTDHLCRVRNCVNPDHLFLGTRADNVADMLAKGRQAAGDRHGSRPRDPRP